MENRIIQDKKKRQAGRWRSPGKMPESGDDRELKEHVGIVVLNEKKSRFLFRKKYMEYIVLSVKWV